MIQGFTIDVNIGPPAIQAYSKGKRRLWLKSRTQLIYLIRESSMLEYFLDIRIS